MSSDFVEQMDCPVCGQNNSIERFQLTNTSLFYCKTCQLKYLNPCLSAQAMTRLYQSEESLLEQHDFHEGYYGYGQLGSESQTFLEFSKALEKLRDLKGKDLKINILDVGFGNGFFLALAQKRGFEVHGIDSSGQNVQKAQEKFNLNLQKATFEDFEPKKGQNFDVISFWDVLEHMPNPHAALKKAHQMLAPGGFVLVGIPNDRSAMSKIAGWLYRWTGGVVDFPMRTLYFLEHVCYYNRHALNFLFEKNGFQEREFFYSRTDLKKYKLRPMKKLIANGMLLLGRLVGLENRMVAIYQKKESSPL